VITGAIKQHWGERLEHPELLDRLHSRAGVKQRYLSFPLEKYTSFETFGETNRAWLEVAAELGERAIDGALERAGLQRSDLDALYVVSVTGVASPSLDARLINRMGLRPDIKRTPIFGVGCVGGAIGLTRAADYAVRVMIHLATVPRGERASLPAIVEATGAPEKKSSRSPGSSFHDEGFLMNGCSGSALKKFVPSAHARKTRESFDSSNNQRITLCARRRRPMVLSICPRNLSGAGAVASTSRL